MDDKLSTSDILIFLAASEFLIIIIIGIVAFLFVMSRRKKSDTNATSNLANKIKSSKVERKSELSNILADTYNIEGKKLKKETEKLIKLENQFYQRFIKTYLTRDANAVEMIDEDLKELLTNYNKLVPKHDERDERAEEALAVIENLSEDTGEQEEQINRLKETINNLSDDLKQYKNTINRLFFEYSAMFGVDVDPRNQLSATEILSRLETGRLGDEEPSLDDLNDDSDEVEFFDDSVDISNEENTETEATIPAETTEQQPAQEKVTEQKAIEESPAQEDPVEGLAATSAPKESSAAPAQPLPDELLAELLGDDAPSSSDQPKPQATEKKAEDQAGSEPKSELETEEDEFEKEFAQLVGKDEDK